MTILTDLAAYLAARQFSVLSADEQEAVRVHVCDTVCASLVGSRTPDGQGLLALQQETDPVTALMASPLDDIATRAGMTRLSEIDDIHLPSGTTPGSIIVPTALTLSAHLGIKDPAAVTSAVIAGYEAMTRLGAAADGQNLVYRGVWTTYFTSPFGTAAIAAHLLGLDETQYAHALAIALTITAGRMGPPGTEKTSRWLMVGHAARAGVLAALSAGSGYTGALALLDGPWMQNAHGVETDSAMFLDNTDDGCVVSEISTKPYCSAKQMIATIAGFEEILGRGIAPDEIDQVLVSVPSRYSAMIDHGVVEGDRLSSATSAPYQLALAAYNKEGLFDVARTKFILNGNVTGFMEKVSVEVGEALGDYLPGNWPGRVTVTAGSRTEEATVIDAPGDPKFASDMTSTLEKFANFAGPVVGADQAAALAETASTACDDAGALAKLQAFYLNPNA
jgi:2-methylcitrate dehydratase PrpD